MGSDADGSVNEFLSQDMSYAQFLALADGKKAKITLGSREFQLTSENLQTLRNMADKPIPQASPSRRRKNRNKKLTCFGEERD
jgi:hypothetical protein